MFESILLKYANKTFSQCILIQQLDAFGKTRFKSLFLTFLHKKLLILYRSLVKGLKNTSLPVTFGVQNLSQIVVFSFIVIMVIFPGVGSEYAAGSFIGDSPIGSSSSHNYAQLGRFLFTLSLFSMLLLTISNSIKNVRSFSISKLEIILAVFLISLELSILFSTYFSISFTWIRQVATSFLIYFVFSRFKITKETIITICLAFLSVFFIEFLLALSQFFSQGFIGLPIETAASTTSSTQLFTNLNNESVFRPTGTLGQGNTLAYIIAAVIPFIFALLFVGNRYIKVFAVAAITLCSIVAIIALSRWGVITLMFSFLCFWFIFYINKIKNLGNKISFYALCVIASTLVFLSLNANLTSRFSSYETQTSSLDSRIQLIIQSTYVISHNPWFGIGGGTFPQYLINYDFTPDSVSEIFPAPVHNLYLLILSEAGIIVFMLFLVFIFYFIASFFKAIRTVVKKDKFVAIFLISIFTSCMTILFSGLWEVRLLDQRITMGLLLMNIGMFVSIVRKYA